MKRAGRKDKCGVIRCSGKRSAQIALFLFLLLMTECSENLIPAVFFPGITVYN
jgi:hypothetical protein